MAQKRLLSVLAAHGAALTRTLEQKISDAGPLNQRIDPHVLTPVRNAMVQRGELISIHRHGRVWYARSDTPADYVDERIARQFQDLKPTLDNSFTRRIGDALEIAVFRALRDAPSLNSLGGFRGLTNEPTTRSPKKEEPPSIFRGRELTGNKRFDFLVGTDIWAGVECKNIREWLYPDREETKQMLLKAILLDIPPILIGRRIPFVTRRLLQPAGVLLWETRNQLYPPEYDNVAAAIKEKTSLGFFDIRVTDFPDARLRDFITRIIPEELPRMRQRFDAYRDLLERFAFGDMSYHSFVARIRRRENGSNEDTDVEPEEEPSDDEWLGEG